LPLVRRLNLKLQDLEDDEVEPIELEYGEFTKVENKRAEPVVAKKKKKESKKGKPRKSDFSFLPDEEFTNDKNPKGSESADYDISV